MKRGQVLWKRIAILAAALVGLCLLSCGCLYVFGRPLLATLRAQMWKSDPQLAESTAREMIDYDLPPGYQEAKVFSIQQASSVIVEHRERAGDIILIQSVPDGIISEPEWRDSFEENAAKEICGHRYDTRTSGTQTAEVRGQEISLLTLEGTDENGRQVRQVVGGFRGKNGDVLLVIVAGQDAWDQTAVDQFLQSIR